MSDRIAVWWQEFQKASAEILQFMKGSRSLDLAAWMHEHLGPVHPRLMWEFGPGLRTEYRLVITAEGRRELRPLVAELLRRAPKLPEWEFYGYRLPESYELTRKTVRARTGGDIEDLSCSVRAGDENDLELTFWSDGSRSRPDSSSARHDAFVAVETLLGEEVLDHWVGPIEVVETAPEGVGAVPIARLRERAQFVLAQILASLPDRPYHRLDPAPLWTAYRLEPQQQEDYAGQEDLFVATTMVPAVWGLAHSDRSFSSRRFSRHGEWFAYVKLDGPGRTVQERFQERSKLGDRLDGALRAADLGCVFGGGTGLRYSYIDLTLMNIPRAEELVCSALREADVDRRSWLLFFDADLRGRWKGVWEDTPAPPAEQKS